MAHQDAPLAQGGIHGLARQRGVRGKDEVGFGIGHGKAEFSQFVGEENAVFRYRLAVFAGVVLVLKRPQPRRHGHGIDVVGVGGILDGIEVGDQFLAGRAEAEPSPRHRAGFGKGLRDEQIFVLAHERQTTLAAEIDVGLVHHHHVIGVLPHDLLDLRAGERKARGRVGVGDEDRFAKPVIVGGIENKAVAQRDLCVRHAVERREYLIKAVGDIGKGGGRFGVAKRHKGKVEDLVRAVGHQDLAR